MQGEMTIGMNMKKKERSKIRKQTVWMDGF